MSDPWIRVTPANPCPICRKPDWCTVGAKLVMCCRVESDRPCKAGGWFHSLGDTTKLRPLPAKPEKPVVIDAERIMAALAAETGPEMVEQLAESLGVSVRSLDLIGAAWSPGHRAWAFPMKDGAGKTIGIRLRDQTGHKWAVKGSRAGLFYAEGFSATALVVTEGPTDTAAAISVGFEAIGRPSCMGCEEMVNQVAKRKGARRVIIVSDNDEPGFRGAERLQASLSMPSLIWCPPAKDMREFVRCGGTIDVVESLTRSMIWTQPKRQTA